MSQVLNEDVLHIVRIPSFCQCTFFIEFVAHLMSMRKPLPQMPQIG